MKKVLKWLGWGALVVLGLATVAAAAGFFWLRGSLPRLDGERTVPGLTAPVEVIRDEHGVPHILAESETDALFALGFVHAQDRLWQMEMNRRIGAGRLAEVLGPPALSVDRLIRMLGLYRRAEASLGFLNTPSREKLSAYVRGVNAWLGSRAGPLPPEFLILGIEPAPWSEADSAVWPKVMALDLAREWTRDQMRLRLSKILTPDRILDFYPPYRAGMPRGVLPSASGVSSAPAGASRGSTAEHALLRSAESPPDGAPSTDLETASLDLLLSRTLAALPPLRGHPGSNSWVVGGTRSATGKPLLANDPHLGLTVPSVWYLVHLSWPGRDLVGVTFPGMPAIVLGHNGRVAWGFTNTGPDVQDVFVEKLDPSDRLRYLAPDGWRAFDLRRERIRIKDADDVVLEVRESRHGPVLDDAWGETGRGETPGHVHALAWTALHEDDLTLQAGLGLAAAHDWPSFLANLEDFHAPQQNVSYADVDGNIGFIAAGRIPIRLRQGEDRPGTMPRPGWDAGFDWQGFVPFDELPRVYNPEGGAIATANHRIVPDDYPHHLTSEWAGGYRAERIMERLAARAVHDLKSFRDLQQDDVSTFARALLPVLRRADIGPEVGEVAARARALLDDWDGTMDPRRAEPLIFHAWIWEFGRLVSADELGPHQRRAWTRKGAFIQRVLEERPEWCDDGGTPATETCDEMLARALATSMSRIARTHGGDPAEWRWGEAHVAIGKHRPFGETLLAPLFNLRGPAPGSIYTVNAFEFSPLDEERPFASTHGPSFRAIYDLADLDRSLFIHSTGQSGNVLSPLYRNFEARWRDGEYIAIPTQRAAFEAAARGRLRLVPQ